MNKTFDDHIRKIISDLVWQVAQLQFDNDRLQFDNDQLRAAIGRDGSGTPPNKITSMVESSNGG